MSLQWSPILGGVWGSIFYYGGMALVLAALIGLLIFMRKQNED